MSFTLHQEAIEHLNRNCPGTRSSQFFNDVLELRGVVETLDTVALCWVTDQTIDRVQRVVGQLPPLEETTEELEEEEYEPFSEDPMFSSAKQRLHDHLMKERLRRTNLS